MAQTIVSARTTNGTLTPVQLTADPTRLEIRGTFDGAEVLITGGNDGTNVQPLAGGDSKPIKIYAPVTLSIDDFVTNDYIGAIFREMGANSSITIEVI